MFPDSVGAIFGILLAITPGLAYQAVRERRQPKADRSTFQEVSGIAVASLVSSMVALVLLLALQIRIPSLLPDPSAWLEHGRAYVVDHVAQVLAFVVVWAVLSSGLAMGAALLLVGKGGQINPHTMAWFQVFRRRVPRGTVPMVCVHLHDGTEYIGRVVYYDTNVLPAERELILGPALFRKEKDEADFSPLPADQDWARVVIPAPSIETMWVRYAPRVPTEA